MPCLIWIATWYLLSVPAVMSSSSCKAEHLHFMPRASENIYEEQCLTRLAPINIHKSMAVNIEVNENFARDWNIHDVWNLKIAIK